MHTSKYPFLYITAALLAAIALAVSFSLPPIQQIRDSLYWARVVDEGTNFYATFNPHHLVYLPVLRVALLGLGAICPGIGAIDVAQILGSASLAISAATLFFLALHLCGSVALAAALSLVLIASRNMWVYSMQVSPYVPMVASLMLLALAVVARGPQLNASRSAVIAVAAPYAVAVLLHQAAVLIGFAIAAYLLATQPLRSAAGSLLRIGLWSGLPVLIGYVGAFVAIYGIETLSLDEFVKYITRYATINDPIFASFTNFSMEGLGHLFLGQLENFLIPPWSLRFLSLVAFAGLLLILTAWNISLAMAGSKRGPRVFFVTWLLLMLAFTLWASPRDDASKLLNLVPIFALSALALGDCLIRASVGQRALAIRAVGGGLLLMLAGALAVRTIAEDVKPLHSTYGKKYESARLAVEAVPPACRIIDVDQEVLMNLYFYFDRDGLDGWDVITWFYYGKPDALPWTWENFRFSNHSCVAIKGQFLSPTVGITKGVDGNSKPDKWYSFIEWLIGFEYSGNQVASTRCMNGSADSRGNRYLLIDVRSRCDVAGLPQVMEELDRHIGTGGDSKESGVFQEWSLIHGEATTGFRQRPRRDRLS